MKSAVTVDVEGVFTNGQHDQNQDSYESVDVFADALDPATRPMTLFVTPGVVEHRPETVADWVAGQPTVGLHIHPARLAGGDSDWLNDYDRDRIETFVADGCETFEDVLGTRPRYFRAGRWEHSERLLSALKAQGFDGDASLKPDVPTTPYTHDGIRELPLSVYGNRLVRQLLRPWDIDAIPMTVDRFLTNPVFTIGFRALVRHLLAADGPYFMCSFHDYDMLDRGLCTRVNQFQSALTTHAEPVTVVDI